MRVRATRIYFFVGYSVYKLLRRNCNWTA